MSLLIKNARLVDLHHDFYRDIYIEDGLIKDIGENLPYDCKVLDACQNVLMPSFVDLHAHFREPGLEYKEDIESGSKAAAKGGFTLVNLMANTKPIVSSMEGVEYVLERGEEVGLIDLHQCVSITKSFDGENIDHLDSLDSRVKMITDDGMGVASSYIMLKAMVKAREKEIVVMAHAEDSSVTEVDYRLAENLETIRDIYLANYTGAMLHLTHVSTKEAIEEIARAKKANNLISCDVTPHHIALWNHTYRVNPPIRDKEDADALIKAIKNGVVDAIATDHAPHTTEDKLNGSPGLSGLETAFSVAYTTLVEPGTITLKDLSRIMSARPAELLGANKGRFKKGFDADFVLLDLEETNIVDTSKFESKGKNTPFAGMQFKGKVLLTIKAGKTTYKSEAWR